MKIFPGRPLLGILLIHGDAKPSAADLQITKRRPFAQLVSAAPPSLRLLTTLLVSTELVMNADTTMVINTGITTRFQG